MTSEKTLSERICDVLTDPDIVSMPTVFAVHYNLSEPKPGLAAVRAAIAASDSLRIVAGVPERPGLENFADRVVMSDRRAAMRTRAAA